MFDASLVAGLTILWSVFLLAVFKVVFPEAGRTPIKIVVVVSFFLALGCVALWKRRSAKPAKSDQPRDH